VTYDEVIEAGEHIPGMAALWDVATPEERREMVILLLEPGGLYYDMEQKIIAALKPRPAFLPILRMLNGIVEYDEARGLLLAERWQERNRRACIADKTLIPTETPMRSLCASKHWRASRHDEIFWWHGSHGHQNRFAAHDLEPGAPDLTAWPVSPQDWPQWERIGRLEWRFRPT